MTDIWCVGDCDSTDLQYIYIPSIYVCDTTAPNIRTCAYLDPRPLINLIEREPVDGTELECPFCQWQIVGGAFVHLDSCFQGDLCGS